MRALTYLVAALLGVALPAALEAKTLRAGVFVGSNQGGFDEEPLFFASADAHKMFVTFLTFGKLDRDLTQLLQDADLRTVRERIHDLGGRMQLLKAHLDLDLECVAYFSAHGGSDGLHLGGEVYPYAQLYEDLHALPCGLLVVILDACDSGTFLKVKGVTFQEQEFRVKAYNTRKGEIFITSSAESEYAQERDDFRGSVFTTFLVAGLLGEADTNGDGQVTLSEAYAFASRRTLQETFGSARGFQVPTYKYDLEGTQDPVLTAFDPSQEVQLPPALQEGVLTFMDTERGTLWGDFKVGPQSRSVRLPEGRYLVRLRDAQGALHLAHCDLQPGGSARWTPFEEIAAGQDPLKGRRDLHHWQVRTTGAVLWAGPEQAIIRDVNYGGSLTVLVDGLFLPLLYGGLALHASSGVRTQVVFDTEVRGYSAEGGAEGLLGVALWRADFLAVSAELRLGGGYAVLTRRVAGKQERQSGGYFRLGIQGQATWWLSRDIGLILPGVQGALMVSRQSEAITPSPVLSLEGGFQFRF